VVTPRKQRQEQEPAGTDVTEVAPGVLRMQLPIAMPGLGHVNCYALVDSRGVAIVDPGLPGSSSWKALVERLRSAGLRVGDVHSVIVTHSHPDHFGGVGRLVEAAGTSPEIITHAAFRNWWQPHSHADAAGDGVHDVEAEDLELPVVGRGTKTPWGGTPYRPPIKRRLQYYVFGRVMGKKFGPPVPTTRLRHGDVVKLAGREWFAVHTPGHTLDHLCLHDPEGGVVLSGDHVLPTITPHISGMNAGRDPLALFFSSLDRVAALEGVRSVLPAHGHPFDDLRGRTEAIKEHHVERLAKLESAARALGRPATVEELSHSLFRPERWGSMAESETYAHLEHLRLTGRAERTDPGDGVVLYELG
jgi:glyoxylase-like metal-dependent hydrolase (beta-lactamase superfamily II)